MAREQEEGDKVCKTEIGVYGMWRERERPFKANWSDGGRPVHKLAISCIHACRWVKL